MPGTLDERDRPGGDRRSSPASSRRSRRDAAIKGAVITSGKDTFCAGADLTMLETLSRTFTELAKSQGRGGRGHQAVRGEPQAVAALPAARDLRQAVGRGDQRHRARRRLRALPRLPSPRRRRQRPKTRVGLPEVKIGLFPGAGGTQRIARMMPPADALQFLLKGDQLRLNRAKAMKLVDAVVPAGDLIEDREGLDQGRRQGQGAVGRRRLPPARAGRSIPRPA